jgi:hypothetical protein
LDLKRLRYNYVAVAVTPDFVIILEKSGRANFVISLATENEVQINFQQTGSWNKKRCKRFNCWPHEGPRVMFDWDE